MLSSGESCYGSLMRIATWNINGVKARMDALLRWLKEVAPSDDLRNWFHHEEPKWSAFRSKYRKELSANKDAVAELRKAAKGTATLLYGAKDVAHNQAVVLAEYLKGRNAPPATKKIKKKPKKKKTAKKTS